MKTLTKYYDAKKILRLIMDDIRHRHGVKRIKGNFHFFDGVDRKGKIFVRVSLEPIEFERATRKGRI